MAQTRKEKQTRTNRVRGGGETQKGRTQTHSMGGDGENTKGWHRNVKGGDGETHKLRTEKCIKRERTSTQEGRNLQ